MKSIHNKDYLLLIECLKEIRKKKRLTQVELAELLNRDQSYVSKYERCERRIDVIELQSICKALSISLIDFIKMFEKEQRNNGE